ncbi:hypothetical protein LXT21_33300 [Myxococcus sp. K38C18041901]|nr:hypothetical protein [Myxococcus guangdongensis]MCP3063662.1 hypothetical protein [Myxococcus guangdongensis]
MNGKLDSFGSDVRGLFVGLEVNASRNRYTLELAGQLPTVHLGWRS